MAGIVQVNFGVGGVSEVQRAFRTVEQAVARFEQSSQRASKQSAKTRVADAEKTAKDQVRAADRAAKDQIAAWKKADKEEAAIRARAAREAERSEQQKTRSVTREASRAAKELVAIEASKERELEQLSKSLTRKMLAEERKRTSQTEREARERARSRESFARATAGAVGRGVTSGVGTVGRVAMGMVGGLQQLGGGFSIADSVQKRMGAERSAALLSNSAYIPGKTARPDAGAILSQAKAIGLESNTDPADLIDATRDYVAKSADFAGGMKNMSFFAKLAKGSGAKIQDIAGAAGILKTQNEGLKDDQMREMMLNIVGQGKLGAMEIPDLARVAGKVTKTGAMYGTDQTSAQRQLLALSQIAIKTSGSPSEAATVVSNLASDTLKHKDKMPAGVVNKDGRIADPADLIGKVFDKSGGNLGKMMDMGYGARSIKMFEALAPIFDEAKSASIKGGMSAEKANAAGSAAVRAEVGKFTGATYSQGDADKDFSVVVSTQAERLEAVFLKLRENVADALLPELEKLGPTLSATAPAFLTVIRESAPAFAELLRTVGKMAKELDESGILKALAKHPIGAIIGMSIAKEIAGAGLQGVLQKAMAGSLGGGGLAVGSVAIVAAAAMIQIEKVMDQKAEGFAKGSSAAGNIDNARRTLAGKIKDGTATPDDIKHAKELEEQAKKDIAKQKADLDPNNRSFTEKALNFAAHDTVLSAAAGAFGVGGDADEANARVQAAREDDLARTIKANALFVLELEKAGKAVASLTNAAANPGSPNRNGPQAGAPRGGGK